MQILDVLVQIWHVQLLPSQCRISFLHFLIEWTPLMLSPRVFESKLTFNESELVQNILDFAAGSLHKSFLHRLYCTFFFINNSLMYAGNIILNSPGLAHILFSVNQVNNFLRSFSNLIVASSKDVLQEYNALSCAKLIFQTLCP